MCTNQVALMWDRRVDKKSICGTHYKAGERRLSVNEQKIEEREVLASWRKSAENKI